MLIKMIINKFNPNVDIFTEEGVLHLDKEGKGKGTAKVENIVSKLSGYTLVKENKTAVKEENKTTKRATTTKKRATSSKKEE